MRGQGRVPRVIVAGLAIATLASGCASSDSPCWRQAIDVAAEDKGATSPPAAIDALVARNVIEGLPSTGWTGPAAGGLFTSGDYTLTVTTVPDHTGFFVAMVSTC